MNLYRIDVKHYAPKDNHIAIQEYVIANNDKEVFDYMLNEYWDWKEWEQDELESVFDNNGEWEFEVYDLYYGAIQYGWTKTRDNLDLNQIKALVDTDVAKVIAMIQEM